METNDFHSSSARLLRLKALPLSSLPPHPLIIPSALTNLQSVPAGTRASNGAGQPDLRAFTAELLREAVNFADKVIPETFATKGKPKPSTPATAPVQMLASDVMTGEYWIARRSLHENAASRGTASFDEFVAGLYNDHSQHEQEYTPDCYDARRVLRWFEGEDFAQSVQEFEDVHLELYEMAHKMPPPLQNRVFAVLVARGRTNVGGSPGFVLAQVPVEFPADSKEAFYSSGRNVKEGTNALQRSKVVKAQYASVERVKLNNDGRVVWETAVSSDAKGWLPMSLQKLGVPGAVLKDVGLFIDWTSKKRSHK